MQEMLIGLGANLPNGEYSPLFALQNSIELIRKLPGVHVKAASPCYLSPAIPYGSGPDFVNMAAIIKTALGPYQVLRSLHQIENEQGRTRPRRWAPRVCDLDLLAAGEVILPDRETVLKWMNLPQDQAEIQTPEELILPHPRMHQRAFVLVPLGDIAPDWRHPVTGQSVETMRENLAPGLLADMTRL